LDALREWRTRESGPMDEIGALSCSCRAEAG